MTFYGQKDESIMKVILRCSLGLKGKSLLLASQLELDRDRILNWDQLMDQPDFDCKSLSDYRLKDEMLMS